MMKHYLLLVIFVTTQIASAESINGGNCYVNLQVDCEDDGYESFNCSELIPYGFKTTKEYLINYKYKPCSTSVKSAELAECPSNVIPTYTAKTLFKHNDADQWDHSTSFSFYKTVFASTNSDEDDYSLGRDYGLIFFNAKRSLKTSLNRASKGLDKEKKMKNCSY